MVTRDIDARERLISTRFLIPIDSELTLMFRVYPTEPAITCCDKTMYSRLGLGRGMLFLDLSEAASQSILKFVDTVN